MKKSMDETQFQNQLDVYKKALVEKFPDLFDPDPVPGSTRLCHKISKMPRKVWLYVDVKVKVNKFIIGIKSFDKDNREKIIETYNTIPFDMRGRLQDALKYVSVNNEVKFKNSPSAETFELVEKSIGFYKEYFKEYFA